MTRAELPSIAAQSRQDGKLSRTFEAIIFDWYGTAVPDRRADAGAPRGLVESLTNRGVDLAIVSDADVGDIDGQLQARPHGPGCLFLCLNRGSEVFEVGRAGTSLVWRREAAPEEEAALDRAAALAVEQLERIGVRAQIVSQRLNRRRIELIPEPESADPARAGSEEVLAAVTASLEAHGLAGLAAAVELAMDAARKAGLTDARVTCDAGHVEIGLTDKSDSARWILGRVRAAGVGPGLVLIAGDEFGAEGGVTGSDTWMLVPETGRSVAVSVGREPGGVPPGVVHLGGGPEAFCDLLSQQLERRRLGRVPAIDEDPHWTLVIEDGPSELVRVSETLLTLADGQFGTRGTPEEAGPGSDPLVMAQGVYTEGAAGLPVPLPGPLWTRLDLSSREPAADRRVLDLRTGVLLREHRGKAGLMRTLRFSSLAQPGLMALRAEGPPDLVKPGQVLVPPGPGAPGAHTSAGHTAESLSAAGGGIAAAAHGARHAASGLRTFERIAAYRAAPDGRPPVDEAARTLTTARAAGFDRLLAEHRSAWARRWDEAEVTIEGDPQAQLAVRFALFHLMASVADSGEAAVGARGLSGRAYAGHVFWDSDVFVLPMLAATHPAAARAMLEYRLRRLPAARAAAAASGLDGARFPWESARDGTDVTPKTARDHQGRLVRILTGDHEEHITADVAWAAWHYAQWSGDEAFLDGAGRPLLTDTARYWASRIRYDQAGRAHIEGVEGPDEYHVPVDDNAFTNVMARWSLRRAADLLERDGEPGSSEEAEALRAVAAALVDGYDPHTGLYEQFAGFSRLEPLVISEIAQPPIAADVLLGSERVAGAQVLKQADVLMLHQLIPEETAAGSLEPNLRYYGPRTAHGSSLSPAIQAGLLARAGQPDAGLELLRIALRLDLDDLTKSSAGGLHLAAMGGVWQALVYGFLGLWPAAGCLTVDPRLPAAWKALGVTVHRAGRRVRIRAQPGLLTIDCAAPLRVRLGPGPTTVVRPPSAQFRSSGDGWKEVLR